VTSGYYEYRHVVATAETTAAGIADLISYLRWQGHCREGFLREEAPDALTEGMCLQTVKAECEYFFDLNAEDELSVRMRLEELTRTQLQFTFDYVRLHAGGENLAARGRQRVECQVIANAETVEIPVPLRVALRPYAETPVPPAVAVGPAATVV
jgi:enediyne biosynthesis thioesterase